MKKLLFIILALILIGFVWFSFYKNKNTVVVPTLTVTAEPDVSPLPSASPKTTASEKIVSYSDSGFSPSTLTIQKGEVITFKNIGSKMMWVASAMHPTHKVYPGSDITKCGTSLQAGTFDACKGYGLGESWEFQLNESGTWKYHDHL